MEKWRKNKLNLKEKENRNMENKDSQFNRGI